MRLSMKKIQNSKTVSFLSFFLILLGSCTVSFDEEILSSEFDLSVPELIIYKGTIRQVEDQLRIISVEKAAFFTKENRQEIDKADIEEYRDGVLSLKAQADKVTLHAKTNDVRMSGNILVRLEEEGATIFGDNFSWIDADNELTSSPEDEVRLLKDDGSEITGKDIVVDGDSQTVEFRGGASGVLFTEGD